MTSIKERLYARLSQDAAIRQIAGRNIYPQQARQDSSFPMIVFSQTSDAPLQAIEAQLDTERFTFQVDSDAQTYQGAEQLADAVSVCLKNWTDGAITSCRLDEQHDDFDEPRTSSENAVHRVIQVWVIWAKRS